MRIRLAFKWYDLWIGAYWDRKGQTLYVCPVPCVAIVFVFGSLPLQDREAFRICDMLEDLDNGGLLEVERHVRCERRRRVPKDAAAVLKDAISSDKIAREAGMPSMWSMPT